MDLTIRHKAGKKNANADALSRNPVEESVVAAMTTDAALTESAPVIPYLAALLGMQCNERTPI